MSRRRCPRVGFIPQINEVDEGRLIEPLQEPTPLRGILRRPGQPRRGAERPPTPFQGNLGLLFEAEGVPVHPDVQRAIERDNRRRVFEQLRRPLPQRVPRPNPPVGVLVGPLAEPTVPREEGIPRAFHGHHGFLQPERLWELPQQPGPSRELVEPAQPEPVWGSPLLSPPSRRLPVNIPTTPPQAMQQPEQAWGSPLLSPPHPQSILQPERLWGSPLLSPPSRRLPVDIPQTPPQAMLQPEPAWGSPLLSPPSRPLPGNIPPTPPQAVQPQEPFKVPPLPGMRYPYHPDFEALSRDEQMVVYMRAVYGDNLNPPEEIGYGHKLTGFDNILGPYDPEAPFGHESYTSPLWPPPPDEVMTGMDYNFVYQSKIPQEEPTDEEFHRQKVMGQGVANVCKKYNLKTPGEFQRKATELMNAKREREQRQNQ